MSMCSRHPRSQVPPGYGWREATGNAAICPTGTFNEGWNRKPCRACDAANGTITTGVPGADTDQDCYISPGKFRVALTNRAATAVFKHAHIASNKPVFRIGFKRWFTLASCPHAR